jgi:hypothetical protein
MRSKVVILVVLALQIFAIAACNTTANGPLPHSMKGYEMYSWQGEGQWYFTIITGTNRNKNLEEIISNENSEFENGWVNIHVTGVDEAKKVLNRIPAGEWVSWNGGQFVIPTDDAVIKQVLPPEEIVNEIKEHAEKCGLEFFVTSF